MRHTGYWARMSRTLSPLLLLVAALAAADGSGQTWRGLVVAPERRCSPYRADDRPGAAHYGGALLTFPERAQRIWFPGFGASCSDCRKRRIPVARTPPASGCIP